MKDYILTFEFRFFAPPNEQRMKDGQRLKLLTAGIYPTLEEAIQEGNERVARLKKTFKIKWWFTETGRMVTNITSKDKVIIIARIATLDYKDIDEQARECLEATTEYKQYIRERKAQRFLERR